MTRFLPPNRRVTVGPFVIDGCGGLVRVATLRSSPVALDIDMRGAGFWWGGAQCVWRSAVLGAWELALGVALDACPIGTPVVEHDSNGPAAMGFRIVQVQP